MASSSPQVFCFFVFKHFSNQKALASFLLHVVLLTVAFLYTCKLNFLEQGNWCRCLFLKDVELAFPVLLRIRVNSCMALFSVWNGFASALIHLPSWKFVISWRLYLARIFEGVLGTRFGSLEFQIGTLKSKKIGSLELEKSDPYKSIPGTKHFP